MTTSKRGGVRPGAGRPKLKNPRRSRSIRATDEEWKKILGFASYIKNSKKQDKTKE